MDKPLTLLLLVATQHFSCEKKIDVIRWIDLLILKGRKRNEKYGGVQEFHILFFTSNFAFFSSI